MKPELKFNVGDRVNAPSTDNTPAYDGVIVATMYGPMINGRQIAWADVEGTGQPRRRWMVDVLTYRA